MVEVQPEKLLSHAVTLEQIKHDVKLQNMCLLKQQRLSVAPVRKEEYEYIIVLSIEQN